MPIDAECPLCGHKGSVPEKFDGKQVKCPECCNLFVVSPSKASVGAKGGTSGSASGERKVPKPVVATMQSISLPDTKKGATSGSASGQQKIKKASPTQPGTVKNPMAGSASGEKKISPGGSAAQQKAPAKTSDSAQGNQKKPVKSSGSAQGTQKNPAKNATSGSAAGQQKIAPKPPSKDGTQKKPAAKGKNGAGDPFASFTFDEPTEKQVRRRRRQGRMFGNMLALLALLLFLGILAAGSWFTYNHFQKGGTAANLFSAMFSSLGSLLKSEPKATEASSTNPDTKPETKPDVPATEKQPEPPLVVNADREAAVITNGKDLTAQVRVVGVQFGNPPVKDAEAAKEKRLLVMFEVENKGKDPINFQGWGSAELINDQHPPKLTDDANAEFKVKTFPGGAEGQVVTAETIQAGKSLRDLVIFEVPPSGTAFVKVELSAENLDVLTFKDRKFTMIISQAMLAKGGMPKPEGKPGPKPDPKPDPDPKPKPEPMEPAVVAVQKQALQSKLVPSRLEAINALAELGPAAASATPDLVRLLQKDTSEGVRAASAECLGKFGPKAKAAVPALLEAMKKDEFWKVRAEAATALSRMGAEAAKEALPALKEAAKEEKDEMAKKAIEEAIKRLDKGGDKDKAKAAE
jgi:hypothetical protein